MKKLIELRLEVYVLGNERKTSRARSRQQTGVRLHSTSRIKSDLERTADSMGAGSLVGVGMLAVAAIAWGIFHGTVWLYQQVGRLGNAVLGARSGGGNNGGGPPNIPLDGDWQAVFGLLLFFFSLILFVLVILRLPLRPTWLSHKLAAQRLKLSPIAFLAFVAIANSELVNSY